MTSKFDTLRSAFHIAFPYTLPVLAAYGILGMSFGAIMTAAGYPVWLPMVMSLVIFAGSMQFVAIELLAMAFHPVQAFLMTLMVNARHVFYGISMLDKYRELGHKKPYMIFALTDETFSINYAAQIPDHVDRNRFMFIVSILNHGYWFLASALGAVLGRVLPFNTDGLDFSMTAMFVAIFVEQLQKKESRSTALLGLAVSAVCLAVFGAGDFIIPAMLGILAVLTALHKPLEKAGVAA